MLSHWFKQEKILTHIIAFHAQQATEKAFKGVLEEFDIPVIKSHNLQYLYYLVIEKINLNLDLKLLATLDSLYIESRYPGSMGLLPEGKPSLGEAVTFLEFAKYIFQTIKETLSANHNESTGIWASTWTLTTRWRGLRKFKTFLGLEL